MLVNVATFAWFRPDQYDKLRVICKDGRNLPTSWYAWHRSVEYQLKPLEREQVPIMKVDFDVDAFEAWGRSNGRDLDAQGRIDFTHEVAPNEVRAKLKEQGHLPA